MLFGVNDNLWFLVFRALFNIFPPFITVIILKFEIEKFYPGPGLEPGPLALCASALTTMLSRTSADP